MCHSLCLFPCKIQTCSKPLVFFVNAHETFVDAMLQQLNAGKINVGIIWLSDKAYFSLHSFINKQSWHICFKENHHVAVPSFLHPHSQGHGLGCHFFKRTHWVILPTPNDYCSALSGHSVKISGGTKCLGGP